jgi:hypothetical protein
LPPCRTPRILIRSGELFLSSAGFDNEERAREDFQVLLRRQTVYGDFRTDDGKNHFELTITPYLRSGEQRGQRFGLYCPQYCAAVRQDPHILP